MENKNIVLPHDHGTNIAEILKTKPNDQSFADVSASFALISDSTRLKILWILCHCEECVINIAAAVEMSSPAVSHHLRILKQSGLVVCTKKGKEAYYKIADTVEANLIHRIIEAIFQVTNG